MLSNILSKITNKYFFHRIRRILVVLVIVSAINQSLILYDIDIISILSNYFGLSHYIKFLITIAGVLLLIDRSLWLPFLEESVIPCSLINKTHHENADFQVKIKTTPNRKIAFWASFPSSQLIDVKTAYGDYTNSGTVIADDNGIAICKIIKPTSYKLPNGSILPPHIHYRECPANNDLLSFIGPIKTHFIK